MNKSSIHPFPARMAPELAFETISQLKKNQVVLDPMSGSGTSLHIAAKHGCRAMGRDVEPLALLLSGVWNLGIKEENLLRMANSLIEQARTSKSRSVSWFDDETKAFADFWFAQEQQGYLGKLATAIAEPETSKYRDIYLTALSRCIITKDKGASLARDVSHAKPHRVRNENDYDVLSGFTTNIKHIARQLASQNNLTQINVEQDDARVLATVADKSIDCIITSPPYLNAVDYFRGHRLALVWMGYTISELRDLRAKSIGLEKQPDELSDPSFLKALYRNAGDICALPFKKQTHVERYALDMYWVCHQWYRTLRKNRKATVVIADSYSSGISISSTQLIKNAARLQGLNLIEEKQRDIPANKRYLPPPDSQTGSALDNRMKTESVLTFIKP